MREWVNSQFPMVLCALMLVVGIVAVAANRLLTPTRLLVPIKVGRRFGPALDFGWVLLAFIPFWNLEAAVTLLVAECLFASWLFHRLWFVRALGEEGYLASLEQAARNSSFGRYIRLGLASAALMALGGGIMLYLSHGPRDWPFYTAMGVMWYATFIAVTTIRDARWLFRRVRGSGA